ncbi:MAG: OadG family protein [Desulfamplus sp.]|nr:OadG family protein [Desulfamplus sp.]
MYGLQAISASNGWAIAVVGITIVFTGLVLLSFFINQLHKILDIWDNRSDLTAWKENLFRRKVPGPAIISLTGEQKESARQFHMLVKKLDDAFPLPRLLKIAQVSGISLPHSNLAALIGTGIIKRGELGMFTWDEELYRKML